jgi:hypothetical protein
MKKLAVLIILLMGIKGFSQHPELLDKEWFLHHGILDGEVFMPYIAGELQFISENERLSIWHPYCEEGFESPFVFTGQNIFDIGNPEVVIVGICGGQEEVEFMQKHYNIYGNGEIAKNPFTYSIESDGDTYMLTIENGNGDIAVYGNVPLSTEEYNTLTVSIYPNPVSEVMFVKSHENISNITVFDIHGKKVKTVNAQSEINLGGLQSGVYFVSITSENGGIWTEKIVKK